MAEAEVLATRGMPFARFFVSTSWPVYFRFWPVLCGSASESLLLEVDDPEDDVSDSPDS